MIRRAAEEDCSDIYRLVCILEDTEFDPEIFREIYLRQTADDLYAGFVYEADGKIIAFLNMRMEYHLHHTARIAELLEFVVDNEYRSRGIGREMFEYACTYAGEHGCVQIELVSNQRRVRAHRFYEERGMNRSHFGFTMPFDEQAV
ncbi:MAG: GNAT family N-acetyltransferase [Solobacterium sp.]|nr:GNAT family N-acetyltransferase [Solobacterium sp.]